MKTTITVFLLFQLITFNGMAQQEIRIKNGLINGSINEKTKVKSFKGIPYAKAPVGDLRWKAPQPSENWKGVLDARNFGNNAMQKNFFGDMNFRAAKMSEDCLYLNVWTPAKSSKEKLPVLVYFYGGGFVAGDGSEPRYDGESIAAKGIVSLTINYRLGIFGFLAHPELSAEAPYHASGNYGLLDQNAALRWVKENITAFGGDPDKITIAGESAGSISVSAQMASALSKDLIIGAIGESGAMIRPTLPAIPLIEGEKNGAALMGKLGFKSIAQMRSISAEELLNLSSKTMAPIPAVVDGYFLTEDPEELFDTGKTAKVPLLVGWNSTEVPYQMFLQADEPTPENFVKKIKQQYPQHSEQILKLYPAKTREEVMIAATDLASDNFIVYSTWKWAEAHRRMSNQPVFLYLFSHPRPAMVTTIGNASAGLAGGVIEEKSDQAAVKMPEGIKGASHASEIEYALGNLESNKVYNWNVNDYKVSDTMLSYFANFIKTGNPNGKNLPRWTGNTKSSESMVMRIDLKSQLEAVQHQNRYLFWENYYTHKTN